MSKTFLLVSINLSAILTGWVYLFLTTVFSTNSIDALVEPQIRYLNPHDNRQENTLSSLSYPHFSKIHSVNLAPNNSTLNNVMDDHLPSVELMFAEIDKDVILSSLQKASAVNSKLQYQTHISVMSIIQGLYLGQNQSSKEITVLNRKSNRFHHDSKPKRPVKSNSIWTDMQPDLIAAHYHELGNDILNKKEMGLIHTNFSIHNPMISNFNNFDANDTVIKLKSVANDTPVIFDNQKFLETQNQFSENYALEHAPILNISESSDKLSNKTDERRTRETVIEPTLIIPASGAEASKPIFISIGIYGNHNNLEKNIERLLDEAYPVKVQKIKFKNSNAAKLLSGPFHSRDHALKALKKVVRMGYIDAYISKG